jgi:hypothetical protein
MFSLLTLSSDANSSSSVLLTRLHLTFSHLHHAQLCTHPTTPDTPKPLYRKSLCRLYLSPSMVLLGHLVPTKMTSRLWSFCIRPILVTSLRNIGMFPCQRPLTAGLAAFPAHARMDGGEKQHGDWASGRMKRLPSFAEVLSRRT